MEISDAKERDAVFGSIMAAITNTIGKRSDYTITVPNVHDALYESLGPEKPRHKDVAYSLVIEGSADTAGTIKLNIWLSPEKKTARAIMGTITGRIDGIASRVQECLEALLKKTGQSGDIAADSFSYEDEPVAIYTVKTTDGEDVVFKMTFTGIEDVEDKLEAPFIKNITVIPPEPSVDGSKKVSVRSREGKLVHFETFVKAGRVEKIIVDTDAPVGSSGEYSEVLHIESLKGHSISVTFIWKDPKVFKIKISPDINPFGPIEAANL
ncbi:MAG: hypothetical protein KKF80_03495 [Candidatus Omnitrophica bacterium]|nr:hypothetical protein [Candidatus Omnitrophota bacterium]